MNLYNDDGTIDREMLDIMARQGFFAAEAEDMEQALELSAAGWAAEIGPHHTAHPFKGAPAVMSWNWRRPTRVKHRPGRLFHSTNQAWMSMRREKGLPITREAAP